VFLNEIYFGPFIEVIMQVSVESPTKLQRRLTVTVPVEQMDAAYDERLSKLAKTAKVKGFRPGNVPLSHIKQLYGEAARQEALSDVIQSSLYAAINQEKLNPVGVPTVEPKNLTPGQPIEFIATFEVLPEIEDVKFEAKEIEKNIAVITEADVDKVVDRLSEQYITWKEVTRPAQDKDQVVIDFRGSIDGKLFDGGEAHDYPMILGSKSMIPGFEEGVIGMTAGEKKVINVTFPETYFAKEMAGKDAEFTIDARKVSEPHNPAIDEELVKKFGIKSGKLDELRAEIKKNLDREVERLIQTKLKAKIFDILLGQNELDVPEALIEQESKRIHDELHPHHAGQDHGHSKEEMSGFNDAAKRNVRLGLIMGAFIKLHNITPDKSRVQDHITKMAASYENPAEVIKWYASDKRRLAEVEMQVLEEQVTDKLLEGISVKENVLNYADLINS
jgi:trigger factor